MIAAILIDPPVSTRSSADRIQRWIGRLAILREEIEDDEDRERVDEEMDYWREVLIDKRRR